MEIIHQFLTVLILVAICSAQSANYVRYDNYSSADFDSAVGQFVPTSNDCLAQSNANPTTNGVVYNDALKICKVLTALNNEVLVRIHVNPGWTLYVKDISDRSVTVFKVQAAQSTNSAAVSVANAFNGDGGTYTYTSTYSSAVSSLDTSTSCNCTYRNPFLDNWNASQAWVQIFKGGLPIAMVVFNAAGQSRSGWFAQANTIASAPYSLPEIRKVSFNRFGSAYNPCSSSLNTRTFFMWQSKPAFCQDNYYMVTSIENACCGYVTSPYPNIFASLTKTYSSRRADFLVITVKTASRVVVVP